MNGDVTMRYIGSKQLLLENIEELLNKHLIGNEKTFLDLFAGTNVVGNYFKKDYTIYANDMLYFSYVNAKATIENNEPLTFKGLKNLGINNPLTHLQSEADKLDHRGCTYYEESYSPSGGAMYFTVENAKRIDYIRNTIELWNNNLLLTEGEYYYLLSSLIEAIPFVSNTTGTYGAYLKHWDKRALKPLELNPIEVIDNQMRNKTFNEDSNELIKKLKVDIAYIDTPYNNRQYASNYHVLENIARNNKPELTGITKIFEWSDLKSDYAMKRNALNAMDDLVKNIDATHIILSYNDEGIIPLDELVSLLKGYSVNGKAEVEYIDYRKYKSKVPSKKNSVHEVLIYIQRQLPENKSLKIEMPEVTNTWRADKKTYIKSPLNYIGGKYKLLKQILPLFPTSIDTFVDMFSGGANVGINVEANKYIFNDMNTKINEMFRYFLSKSPDDLVKEIRSRIDEYGLSKVNESAYLHFRSDYNANPNPLDLYVLVSFSYNYQFRFNNSMKFNNPFGKNRSHFSDNMEKNLRQFVTQLKTIDVKFTDELFTNFDITHLTTEDFVYLDPPYLITTGNYNDGNRGFLNWGPKQELEMYALLTDLSNRGVRWALSNVTEHKGKENEYLKEFIEQTDVYVNYLDYSYHNSSHNTSRGKSTEVLITNYDVRAK